MIKISSTYLRWAFLSTLSGLLSGTAGTLFLYLLDWATKTRESHTEIIWILPVAGLLIGLVYHHFGKDVSAGNALILEEIHDPKKITPLYMTPFILVGTILTHLFGGSAGREGTAVQMGASLSDQLSHIFKIEPEERKILLMAGTGAGFGAAIGAPVAGMLFGMEVIWLKKIRLIAWFQCLIASFIGYYTTIFLRAPHSHYPAIPIPSISLKLLFFIALSGIVFGLAAKFFCVLTHWVEKIFSYLTYPPLRPFFAGLILIGAYQLIGTYQYAGLGISTIQQALHIPAHYTDPALKTLFTALTVGSGFKGGEFIPLVFIGTTLGSALSLILPVSCGLLAVAGFAAVFSAAANTPIACTFMAMELFGYEVAPYALLACVVSYYVSGRHSIYKGQR